MLAKWDNNRTMKACILLQVHRQFVYSPEVLVKVRSLDGPTTTDVANKGFLTSVSPHVYAQL